VLKGGQLFSFGATTMSNPSLICDECRRPLKAPSPLWVAPSNAVALCKKCSRVSGPAPGSGLMPCVLELEPDTEHGAAATH